MQATLYRNGAIADARSDELRPGISILVVDGAIAWIRPSDDEGPLPDGAAAGDVELVDAGGCTFVPGMVDAHSHLTMPGGSHWIARLDDPVEDLLAAAERNARLLTSAGVRWSRDVGGPMVEDPAGGRRALNLRVRDAWRGRVEYPYVRAAGAWLDKAGTLPGDRFLAAANADELLANALTQLDDGADLLKLYLDGPEPGVAPWTVTEIRPVIAAAHARGVLVTAHSGNLAGARVGVAAGVDCLEHGSELDADVARQMAAQGTWMVSTLAIYRSWLGFGRTTTIDRFASPAGQQRIRDRQGRAEESLRHARNAGVRIAAGTDFGGGSTRANQLAWEVESMVAAGMEPWEALASATWRGGDLLGEPAAGRVEQDGPADFFLVHGDPLSDPAALWRVWRTAWAR